MNPTLNHSDSLLNHRDSTLNHNNAILNHNDYVSMTMEFRCNLKCVHCMIEDTMDRLKPESIESFRELLAYNHQEKRWQGLILTGSEITLNKNLADMAKEAKAAGFERIRIQSHGMKLAKPNYLQSLVEAGINEFFISMTSDTAENHDAITLVQGSFLKALQGLENIDQYDNLIAMTNTVVTQKSYRQLPQLVKNLSHLKNLKQMEFWVFWPMQEDDSKDLMASHSDILPYLKEAIALAKSFGRTVEIKNFPACLLGEDSDLVVNAQPQLYIDPAFWDEFSRNGFYNCAYKAQCQSKECLGLNTAYVKKYGWEKDILSPL